MVCNNAKFNGLYLRCKLFYSHSVEANIMSNEHIQVFTMWFVNATDAL